MQKGTNTAKKYSVCVCVCVCVCVFLCKLIKQNGYLRATEKLLSGVSSWSTSCGRSLYPINVPSLLSKKYLGLHVFMYSPGNK